MKTVQTWHHTASRNQGSQHSYISSTHDGVYHSCVGKCREGHPWIHQLVEMLQVGSCHTMLLPSQECCAATTRCRWSCAHGVPMVHIWSVNPCPICLYTICGRISTTTSATGLNTADSSSTQAHTQRRQHKTQVSDTGTGHTCGAIHGVPCPNITFFECGVMVHGVRRRSWMQRRPTAHTVL